MPSIETNKSIMHAAWMKNPKAVFMLMGKPGTGKSNSAAQAGMAYLASKGVDDSSRLARVPLAGFEVVDFNGVPSVEDGFTKFNPTEMFGRFREGTGPGVIVLEELAQCTDDIQIYFANFLEDRETPMFKLDPEVVFVATGNRVEDRAGARKMLAHLSDRLIFLGVDDSLDDWCGWAMENDINPLGIAFLRLRPNLLNDFDPNRTCNPTQRSWTKLFTMVPDSLPTDQYMAMCEGIVGEGAAAEWVAARDMMLKMPSIDQIRLDPERTEVPEEPAVRYAVATALSMTADIDSFERDMKYVDRMPKEFQMVYVTDTLRLHPKLQQTKAFIDWAIANKDIFMNSH